jgi:hypothetical protein
MRSWRLTGFSVACVPLLLLGWFQFSGEESEAETTSPGPAETVARDSRAKTISRVTSGHFEFDDSDTGPFVQVASSEVDGTRNGAPSLADPDAKIRAVIAGEWEDEYQGKRHLTVSGDGTGKMVVDLEGIAKKVFAARLSFDIEWTLADGTITMKTLGGEPKSKTNMVLKLYGNEAQYKILELTADRMLLLDGDGKTQYDWHRPGTSASGGTTDK